MSFILVGDCGGTNTRLILYEVPTDFKIRRGAPAPGRKVHGKEYRNEGFNSFDDVLKSFLSESGITTSPQAACFAVAGPVENNAVTFTNRSWKIDGASVGDHFGIRDVRLINDFVATGYGLLTLDEKSECVRLNDAEPKVGATIATIGPGTGLGECYLTAAEVSIADGDGSGSGIEYTAYASEGGHTEFAPRSDVEIELLKNLKELFTENHRVSVERVVSGTGLWNIYQFLAQRFPDRVNGEVHGSILKAGDLKGKVIAENSSEEGSLCQQTMDIFASAFGCEAGAAALKWLPYGGLYLTGGLTPKNLSLLVDKEGPFIKAYKDKGRLSRLVWEKIPLKAVLVEDLGTRGAHYRASQIYLKTISEQRKSRSNTNGSSKTNNNNNVTGNSSSTDSFLGSGEGRDSASFSRGFLLGASISAAVAAAGVGAAATFLWRQKRK